MRNDEEIRSSKDAFIEEHDPCWEAFSEFQSLYEGLADQPAILLSLGTGQKQKTHDGNDGPSQDAQMRQYAGGEHSWYERLSVSHGLCEIPIDDWVVEDWQKMQHAPGRTSFGRLEEVTHAYLEREFDASVDSYAAPKVMLTQIAEKLVRQRRAREIEGGERWRTFVGEDLPKEIRREPRSEAYLRLRSQWRLPSRRDDALTLPETLPESSHHKPWASNPGNAANYDDGFDWTPTSMSPEPSEVPMPVEDLHTDRKDLTPEQEFDLFPKPMFPNEPHELILEDNTRIRDSLLRSILKPTSTASAVEMTCHKSSNPLLGLLECSLELGGEWQLGLVHFDITLRPIKDALQAMVQVLDFARDKGICDSILNILMEDSINSHVLHTVSMTIFHIKEVLRLVQVAESPARSRRVMKLLQSRANQLLRLLQLPRLQSSGSGMEILRHDLYRLCLVFSISAISYVRSHCWELDARLVPSHVHRISMGRPRHWVGASLVFQRRDLGYLATFIGSSVWTLGRSTASSTTQQCKVSLTLTQFADLWGPIWAVSTPGQPGQLLAVRTEGGILYQASAAASQETHSPIYVECHWAPTTFTRRSLLSSHTRPDSCFAILDSGLLGELVPFDGAARLLVGTPLHGQSLPSVAFGSSLVDSGYQTQTSLAADRESLGERGQHPSFSVNASCSLDFQDFVRDNGYQVRMAGTAPARYLSESYQASFTAGKYVVVGRSKTFRRRPASTMKQRIIDYCSKPFASLRQILELRIGLEVSACSDNAQRISLWQALSMAYGTSSTQPTLCGHRTCDLAYARDCWGLELPSITASSSTERDMQQNSPADGWTQESRTLISGLIGELSLTGLLDNDEFHCLVPPCQVLAKSTNPEWTALLKDTDTSACFAILTNRCLTFDGRDSSNDSRKARKCCTGTRPPTVGPLLCTSILLKLDAQHFPLQQTLCAPTARSLDLGHKIPAVAGYLVAKNNERPLQLLSYHRQRFGTLRLKEPKYREHFSADANQGNVVRVAIM